VVVVVVVVFQIHKISTAVHELIISQLVRGVF
jgi:hypothetical protein